MLKCLDLTLSKFQMWLYPGDYKSWGRSHTSFGNKYHVLNSATGDRSLQFLWNETPGRVDIRGLASLEAFTIGFWMKTEAFTIGFWMKTGDRLNKGTPFSYGTSDQSNELLLYNYQEFQLIIHGERR